MNESPKKQGSRTSRYIGYFLFAVLALLIANWIFFRVHEVSGSNESFAIASEKCWRIKEILPLQATNISYQCRPYYPNLYACFVLSENDFQAWATEQKWALKALTPESEGATIKDWEVKGLVSQKMEIIKSGFAVDHKLINESFSKKMPWQAWVILYDRDHETVYLKIITMD